MKIISHSADADGKLSAFLVAKKFNITTLDDIIMTDYGKGSDFLDKIEKDEKVIICDFSFENGSDDMKKLLEITKDVIWIDHHESSIKSYGKFGDNIKGLRINGTAACMLTYIYFYLTDYQHNKEAWLKSLTQEKCEELYKFAPLLVRYVHDNDVWRYEYGEKTEWFKLGLDAESISSPIDKRWNELFTSKSDIDEVLSVGKICKKYRDSMGQCAINSGAFEYEINGKKGLCMNMILGGSPWFGDKVKEYDFICSFHYTKDGIWEYSFYSDNEKGANCYEIAQSVDPKGGGHLHAAGCTTKKFIFDNKK